MIVKLQSSRMFFISSVCGGVDGGDGGVACGGSAVRVLGCIVALMYQTLRMTAYHSLHLLYN